MLLSRLLTRRTPAVLQQVRANSTQGYGDANAPGTSAAKETENKEHPGPSPVDEGKGAGSGHSEGNGKPQPKIWDQKEPSGSGNPEVEKHNQDMKHRYGKAEGKDGEPVSKQYWKGRATRRTDCRF
jgi:hypothetical protein